MTPLKLDNLREYKECAGLCYKEHHIHYFNYLMEDKNGTGCVVCDQYWTNDTIEQEMKLGEYAT